MKINLEDAAATDPPTASLVNDDFILQPINTTNEIVRDDTSADHETVLTKSLLRLLNTLTLFCNKKLIL